MFLSLLLDEPSQVKDQDLWAVYFDITITPKCFDTICNRSAILYRSSQSLDAWNTTPYGRVLKFTDQTSLTDVRRFWDYYASMSKMPSRALDTFTETFMMDFRKLYNVAEGETMFSTIYRSFGPVFRAGKDIFHDILKPYKQSGNFGDATKLNRGNRVNPLFVFSSIAYDRCALPRGMSQMAPFHVGSAFVYTTTASESPSNELAPYSSDLSPAEKVNRVTKCIKSQFKNWCSAFQKTQGVITIYHHTDDVPRFCYSLQTYLDPSVKSIYEYCSAPWNPPRTLQKFTVDASPYGPFDVIETSNLADEIALPALLVIVLPLLKQNREATIYTMSLVPADKTPPAQRLKSLLHCDSLTMFALLSCVPAEYVSGFCNNSSLHEVAMPVDAHVDIARRSGVGFKSEWKFSWKRWIENDPDASKPVPLATWETDTMVQILWDIYVAMFTRSVDETPRRCTPGHFCAFLGYLQKHVTADWKSIIETVEEFLGLSVRRSNIRPGSSGELIFQLHLHQLTSHNILGLDWALGGAVLPGFKKLLFPPNHSYPPGRHPLAAPYIMRVPRSCLSPLVPYIKRMDRDLSFRIQIFHSEDKVVGSFSCFEITFGSQDLSGIRPYPLQEGWEGEGDMFVHIYLPVTFLMVMIVEPKFKVCLCLEPTIGATLETFLETFQDIYGLDLIVFGTDFKDTTHLWPCHPRLVVSSSSLPIFKKIELPKVGRVITVPEIAQPSSGPPQMTCRVEIHDEVEKRDLLNGCQVDFRSVSPLIATVQTPKWTVDIPFPYPYNKDNARLRISRKGAWFEIIAKFETKFELDTIHFPIARDATARSTVSCNLPRILLDQLATLDMSNPRQQDWITANLNSMFSGTQIGEMNVHELEQVMAISIPYNIMNILTSSDLSKLVMELGLSGGPFMTATIVLGLPDCTPVAFIFIDSIKLHPAANSIVADTHVWPMTDDLFKTNTDDIIRLTAYSYPVKCRPKALRWWLLFLRASIERSRQWSHSSECYVAEHPRLSYIDAICSCGQGKVSAKFSANTQWAKFAPFVTRCALSTIFPVPYVDPISTDVTEYFTHQESPEEAVVDVSRQCLLCKSTPEQVKKCGKCGKAKYCSRECQAKDWARHKGECHS